MIGQTGPKTKTSSDLLENLQSRYFKSTEYKCNIDILVPKTKFLLNFLENCQFEGNNDKYGNNYVSDLRSKI